MVSGKISGDPLALTTVGLNMAAIQGGGNVQAPSTLFAATANNLSDLANPATALTNLGGLSSALAASTYLTQVDAALLYQPLDADLTSWAGVTRAAGFDAFAATPSSANLRTLLTDETGTGSAVFATSPTLETPALGTPTALVLTNATGLVNAGVDGAAAIDDAKLNHLQPGTGAVNSSVFAILKERIRPTRFGADPAASGAVNRAAINNAVNSAGANGAIVELPAGVFDVDGTVIPLAANVTLQGDGEATTLRTTSATAHILDVAAQFVTVRDLQFGSSVTRTAGRFVNVQNTANRFELRNFHMEGAFEGIGIGSASTVTIRGGKMLNGVATTGIAIRVTGVLDATIADILADQASQLFAGVYATSCGDVSIEDCQFIHCGQALYLNPGAGQVITSLFANNTFFDTSSRGLYAQAAGAGAVVARCIFDECWFSSALNEGIRLETSGGGAIDGIDFINPHIFLNAGDGASIIDSGVINTSFINPAVCQNTGDGLKFATGVNKFRILGGKSGDGYGLTGNTGYGINLVGTSDNITIMGVQLTGNTLGAISTTLAPSPTRIMHSNSGAIVARVVPDMQVASVKGSANALSNSSTSAQAIFPAANDTLLLIAATTYRFKAKIGLNTGATSHTTAFSLGGTATFTSIAYTANTTSAATPATLATPQMASPKTAAATVLNAASTAVRTDIVIEGEFEINAAGTIIPQVTFSAGPTGTCEVDIDSFFEVWSIGPNSVNFAGQWT